MRQLNGHGGKRKGAGRKPKLTREQEFELWLYLHRVKAWSWKRNRKKWKIAKELHKRSSELAKSYELIKRVQISDRPLIRAAGKLDQIDEKFSQKLIHAEKNFGFEDGLAAMEQIRLIFNPDIYKKNQEETDIDESYRLPLSRHLHFRKFLTRIQICELGARYILRKYSLPIHSRQVERVWRKHGVI